MTDEELIQQVNKFIGVVDKIEVHQKSIVNSRHAMEESIIKLMNENKENKEALDICQHAIEILRKVSDEAVTEAYSFLEDSLNSALARMFRHTTRQIRLNEYTRNGQYPQLELELIVANGKKRKLKSDSGHGLAQIVSLLSVLSVIVITNSRRIMVLDEVLSGLSVNNLRIIDEILWTFTQIGFQFMITEHGFIPKGAKVYHFEMVGDVSGIKDSYIEENGVYLNYSKEKYADEEDEEYSDEELDAVPAETENIQQENRVISL